MTYQNDPNLNRNINARRADPNSRNDTTMWIAGAAALLLVFGMIAFSLTNRSEVATNAPSHSGNGIAYHDWFRCDYHPKQSERHDAAERYEQTGAGTDHPHSALVKSNPGGVSFAVEHYRYMDGRMVVKREGRAAHAANPGIAASTTPPSSRSND